MAVNITDRNDLDLVQLALHRTVKNVTAAQPDLAEVLYDVAENIGELQMQRAQAFRQLAEQQGGAPLNAPSLLAALRKHIHVVGHPGPVGYEVAVEFASETDAVEFMTLLASDSVAAQAKE